MVKFHPKLNTGSRPIANKYHERKMKRTLQREFKVLEIADLGACDVWALERKSFVWIEVIACNVPQLEHQLLYLREDGPWLMLFCCGETLVPMGIQACMGC